jgi:hypothetical protein
MHSTRQRAAANGGALARVVAEEAEEVEEEDGEAEVMSALSPVARCNANERYPPQL